MKYAALDYQTKVPGSKRETKQESVARVYVPLGYTVPPAVVRGGMWQSISTQRPVAVLPPLKTLRGTKVNGKEVKATTFTPFSEVGAAGRGWRAAHRTCTKRVERAWW